MFIDTAKIEIKSGDGGNGAVSFHREKYIASGGPDGGDGGRGGDVIFVVDDNLATLMDFRYKRKYIAQNGGDGSKKRMSGKDGESIIIKVPRGTLIKDAETDIILKDMSDGEPFIAAKGGKGGWGNSHFATPTRQVPRFAKSGIEGEKKTVYLELVLLADIGIIGFPNVGKSTLLSVVSRARPKVANYHFTTLSPNLGVVSLSEGRSFVMADIPGLIEGAAEGAGLGHKFLRHISRCRLLVHLIDSAGTEGREPVNDFEIINAELSRYNAELASLPQLVVANKIDINPDEKIIKELEKTAKKHGYDFFKISAVTGEGVDSLMEAVWSRLQELPPIKVYESEMLYVEPEDERETEYFEEDGVFYVEGKWLKKLVGSINLDDYESLQYFHRTLKKAGVLDKLEEMGIEEGDSVIVAGVEFEHVE